MATNPDLPSPITPDLPDQPEPADLPVEPDHGIVARGSADRSAPCGRWNLRFRANRQYMGAAAYRWPLTRTSAWIL